MPTLEQRVCHDDVREASAARSHEVALVGHDRAQRACADRARPRPSFHLFSAAAARAQPHGAGNSEDTMTSLTRSLVGVVSLFALLSGAACIAEAVDSEDLSTRPSALASGSASACPSAS